MRTFTYSILAILALALNGCGGDGGTSGGGGGTPGGSGITISPDPAVTPTSSSVQLSVSGGTVTWDVQEEGGGSINASGLYTAPSTPGTYHAVATSVTDSTKTDSAELIVVPWSASGGPSSGGYSLAAVWGSEGSGRGQFRDPTGIALDSSGRVYVSDSGNRLVQRFANNGLFLDQWSTASNIVAAGDAGPIAVNSAGDVFVLYGPGGYYNRIYKRTSTGSSLNWGISTFPGFDIDVTGTTIYASNPTNTGYPSVVRIVNQTTGGFWVGGPGELEDPTGVAIDSSGYVYVADRARRVVIKYNSTDRTPVITINLATRGIQNPSGIDVDPSGNIYIADVTTTRIFKLTNTGSPLTSWETAASGPGGHDGPIWVKVDSAGGVFVLDSGNNRVLKYVPHN